MELWRVIRYPFLKSRQIAENEMGMRSTGGAVFAAP
jgi:hypothetical protein